MKTKSRKKFTFTLAAGALAVVMAIGGTFAWFTSTAKSDQSSDFTSATVKLVNDPSNSDESGFKIASFNPTDKGVLDFLQCFEDLGINVTDQNALDVNGMIYYVSDKDKLWFENLFAKDSSGELKFDNYVTPGSLVFSEFTFKNESNVYTYLRIKAKELDPVGQMKASYFVVIEDGTGNVINFDDTGVITQSYPEGDDTYFYVNKPLDPYVADPSDPLKKPKEYKVTLYAYVFGEANESVYDEATTPKDSNGLMNQPFTLGETLTAEAIQASNNAVFLAGDGWSTFATANPIFFIEPDWTESP